MNNTYKETEIGLIPSDWNLVSVKSITKFHKQGYYTTENYKENGAFYLLRGTDMQNPKIDLTTTPKINANPNDYEAYKVLIGDFLFVRSGAIGRYGIVTREIPKSIFGSYLINFRFVENLNNSFFGYFYESNLSKNQIAGITQGGGNLNINAENIKALKIPLPPTLAEQTAIATALSDADSYIASLEKLITKKRLIKQGAMQQLLKPKEGWVVKKLGEISINISSGKSNTQSTIEKYPIYGSTGIIGWKDYFDYEGNRVLVARVGANAGAVNKVSGQYCVSDNTLMISLQLNIDLNFIQYMLISYRLNRLVFGSGQPLITGGQLKNIEISIPLSKLEQTRIANILSDMDSEIATLEKQLSKAQSIKQGMMQQLLTGKIRLV